MTEREYPHATAEGTQAAEETDAVESRSWAKDTAAQATAAARKSVEATGKAVTGAGAVAKRGVRGAGSTADAALDRVKEALTKGVDGFYTECPVAAFMLPTGPDPDDFLLKFDLDDFLENLQNGVFMRPKIELWAASESGHDRQRLTRKLIEQFVEECAVIEGAVRDTGETTVAVHRQHESSAMRELNSELKGQTLRTAGIWTAAVAAGAGGVLLAPVGLAGAIFVPALMLGLGIKPKTNIFARLGDYLGARGDRADAVKQLKQEMNLLGSEIRRKQRAIEQTVGRLKIREHTRLREAGESVGAEYGSRLDQDDEAERVVLPYVERFLHHADYQRALKAQKKTSAGSDRLDDFVRRILGSD